MKEAIIKEIRKEDNKQPKPGVKIIMPMLPEETESYQQNKEKVDVNNVATSTLLLRDNTQTGKGGGNNPRPQGQGQGQGNKTITVTTIIKIASRSRLSSRRLVKKM